MTHILSSGETRLVWHNPGDLASFSKSCGSAGCLLLVGLCGGLVVGCDGALGASMALGGDSAEDAPRQSTLCLESPTLLAPAYRRLTRAQYQTVVTAAFPSVWFTDQDFNALFQDSNPTIGLANDPNLMLMTSASVDALLAGTLPLVQRIAQQDPTVSACIASTDAACLQTLVSQIAPRLWRRPLDANEIGQLVGFTNAALPLDERVMETLRALMMSAPTLYRIEFGTSDGAARSLTSQELANFVSFTFTAAPPDPQMQSLAASDALLDFDRLSEEIRMRASDSVYTETIVAFLWDFLNLDATATASNMLFPSERSALAQSARLFLERQLGSGMILDAFIGSEFPVNSNSAAVFGLDPEAYGMDFEWVVFDPSERLGILSHPAFLSVLANVNSINLVRRGVYFLKQLLDIPLPDPPDNISSIAAEDLPEGTDVDLLNAAELLEVTHSAQPTCASCHQLIDGVGSATYNFAADGRYQTNVAVNSGQDTSTVDASGSLQIGTESIAFVDSVSFFTELVGTQRFRDTLMDAYLNFVFGQTDTCTSEQFRVATYERGYSVAGMAESLLELESLRFRQEVRR